VVSFDYWLGGILQNAVADELHELYLDMEAYEFAVGDPVYHCYFNVAARFDLPVQVVMILTERYRNDFHDRHGHHWNEEGDNEAS
jgi:hypothetical protein